MNNTYHGIIPPVVTPLADDETLDEEAYARLLTSLCDAGMHGIFAMGSSGEAMNVTRSVWKRAIAAAVGIVAERVPVFCGVIDSCTKRVIEAIKEAEQVGATTVVATPAFYLQNGGQGEIIRHYEAICRSTNLEVVVYNIPAMVHANILPETIQKLQDIDNVVAYKDSCGDWEQFQRNLFVMNTSRVSLFNGAEELSGASLVFGAQGCVPGLANFYPKLFVEMYDASLAGKIAEVFELQRSVWDIRRVLRVGKSWMAAMKYLTRKWGFGRGTLSTPVEPLTKDQEREIDAIVEPYSSYGIQPV